VRLELLPGKRFVGWWFDPRSGQVECIGEFSVGGVREFTPPAGGPDWVLVVDDAAQAFARRAPGGA
jgi:hypothetical protein